MEKERTEAEGNSLVDLETARLVLTPVTEEHIDPICAHFTKEVVTYMVPGPAKERGDMEAVVRRFMEQRRAGTDFVYAITLKGSGEFTALPACTMCRLQCRSLAFGQRWRRTGIIMEGKPLGRCFGWPLPWG